MFCQVGSFLIYFVLYLQARHCWLGRAKVGFCWQLWNLRFSSRIISGLTESPVTMSCQLHLVKKKLCGMSCRKSTPNCGHSTYLFVWPLLRHLIIAASSGPHCLLGCFFVFYVCVELCSLRFLFYFLWLLNVFVWKTTFRALHRHCIAVQEVCTCTSSQTRGCNESQFVWFPFRGNVIWVFCLGDIFCSIGTGNRTDLRASLFHSDFQFFTVGTLP